MYVKTDAKAAKSRGSKAITNMLSAAVCGPLVPKLMLGSPHFQYLHSFSAGFHVMCVLA